MGLIAAVLIGQIAIDVGLFVPEVILYASVATVGTFVTPSYELGMANKIARFMHSVLPLPYLKRQAYYWITLLFYLLTRYKNVKYTLFMATYPISAKSLISYYI